ncbi:hypothetical protein PV327_004989 [Microctonus hyperodae]|uniref:S1 motif domain-containing protein n=1 Tax=Microctonus hyperodae TaxID=165561 RepID=A0AA39FDP6_MICHY|nr:hypothetical protein PV327_004989 [Microctonus hyperodae]
MPKRRRETNVDDTEKKSRKLNKTTIKQWSDIGTSEMGCVSSKRLKRDGSNDHKSDEQPVETVRKIDHVHLKDLKPQAISKVNNEYSENTHEWNHVDYILEFNKIDRDVAKTVVKLFEDGNTIPFIARYRRDQTCGLDADQLRLIQEYYDKVNVIKHKADIVIKSIEKAGKLTAELKNTVRSLKTLDELEHIHSLYKVGGKKTLAQKARDIGLGPFAEAIMNSDKVPHLKTFINPKIESLQDEEHVKNGIVSILADIICKDKRTFEQINELRKKVVMQIQTKKTKVTDNVDASKRKENDNKYALYYDWSISEKYIKPHQILAINRAESQKVITTIITIPNHFETMLKQNILQFHESAMNTSPFHRVLIVNAFQQAYKKSLKSSIVRRIKNELNEKAHEASMETFAVNVKQLLYIQPVRGKVIVGIDPGFTNGCKLAAISEHGDVLETAIIYPHQKSENSRLRAANTLISLVCKHECSVLALGNGTACRETELFLSDLIKSKRFGNRDITYAIVDEAGASIYSCSNEAKSEFPNMDYNLISAVSIARRLQDPLAELVKVEPKSLGVGMYQHDLSEKQLMLKLNQVVTEVVSFVGVDVNTASQCLLRRVAGLSDSRAANIIQWRRENGPFINRDQLRKVKGIGTKTFEQCAGFIRIMPETALSKSAHKSKAAVKDQLNYLDQTWIHPESYRLANVFVDACKVNLADLGTNEFISNIKMFASGDYAALAKKFNTNVEILKIIIDGLTIAKGGDIRDQVYAPLFRTSLRSMDDLLVGSLLSGEVRNLTEFGVFVDVGVEKNGLIHVKSLVGETLKIGQRVDVKVQNIEKGRGRIGLILIKSY